MIQTISMQPVEIVRGTTNSFNITIVDSNGVAYNLGSNEKIVFGVKEKPDDQELLIAKTAEIIGAGLFKVVLNTGDTEQLPPGSLYYDIGLDNGTDLFNVIPISPFMVVQNVTFRGCAD